jgi:hypothetical protein
VSLPASLPLDGDVYTSLLPDDGSGVQVLAHGRRVPHRNLWVWYWATDEELTLADEHPTRCTMTRAGRGAGRIKRAHVVNQSTERSFAARIVNAFRAALIDAASVHTGLGAVAVAVAPAVPAIGAGARAIPHRRRRGALGVARAVIDGHRASAALGAGVRAAQTRCAQTARATATARAREVGTVGGAAADGRVRHRDVGVVLSPCADVDRRRRAIVRAGVTKVPFGRP